MKYLLNTVGDLEECGLIDAQEGSTLEEITRQYSVGLSKDICESIGEKTCTDPVYRQYVPDEAELVQRADEDGDPIGDDAHQVTKGLIHRYPDRVLFKVTPTCAVYCRFCFRREMVGRGAEALSAADMSAAYEYIHNTQAVREVILSGGDPLVLSPRRLKEILAALDKIPHIDTIRIHTRLPVAAPRRVTVALTEALQTVSKNMVICVHVNHVQELSDTARSALQQLRNCGAQLLSQTVLLKGVNDDPEILLDLLRGLRAAGVVPYYLHHPDKAPGTAHFRVSIARGQEIYRALRGQISGHALPDYVLDIPGGHGKVPINSDWIAPRAEGGYSVRDIHGKTHLYYD